MSKDNKAFTPSAAFICCADPLENRAFHSKCQICAGLNCDIATITEGIPHLTDAS